MTNKINKERQRSMNATPTRSSHHKSQWQGAQEDPKQNIDKGCHVAIYSNAEFKLLTKNDHDKKPLNCS
jgi:hypothetical protein